MPLKGLSSNVDNLNAYTLQKFQLDTIRPEKIVVAAAGVESHQEFVDLVISKLGSLPKSSGQEKRAAAEYLGGEVRSMTEAPETHLSLVFQGAH